MPSHRRRFIATSALCGLLAVGATTGGCRGPASEDTPDGAAQRSGADDGGHAGDRGPQAGRHPGIEAALAGLQGPAGIVPPEALGLLRESSDPAEQRAYRLLVIRGDVAGGGAAPPTTVEPEGDAEAVTGGGEADEGEAPKAPVALVVSDAAAVEDPDTAAGGSGSPNAGGAPSTRPSDAGTGTESDDPAASATAGTDTDSGSTSAGGSSSAKKPSTPNKPKPVAGLTMITRIALHERGNDVELEIVAAGPLAVGSARGDAEIRVIVEDAGALPVALQARPSAGEVRVTDVRRGDETVQIAVEIPSGWKVASKRSSSSGARVRFASR